jgi:hypothetical protein
VLHYPDTHLSLCSNRSPTSTIALPPHHKRFRSPFPVCHLRNVVNDAFDTRTIASHFAMSKPVRDSGATDGLPRRDAAACAKPFRFASLGGRYPIVIVSTIVLTFGSSRRFVRTLPANLNQMTISRHSGSCAVRCTTRSMMIAARSGAVAFLNRSTDRSKLLTTSPTEHHTKRGNGIFPICRYLGKEEVEKSTHVWA